MGAGISFLSSRALAAHHVAACSQSYYDGSTREVQPLEIRASRAVAVNSCAARLPPVTFEDGLHPSNDGRIADDDADFAAVIERDLSETLAADERVLSVADDRPHVQTETGKLPHRER